MHQKAQIRLFSVCMSKIIATFILRDAVSLRTTRERVLQDDPPCGGDSLRDGFIEDDPIEGTARFIKRQKRAWIRWFH
jgi:hypothetical protein